MNVDEGEMWWTRGGSFSFLLFLLCGHKSYANECEDGAGKVLWCSIEDAEFFAIVFKFLLKHREEILNLKV